jgi:hypothetical protein
MDAVRLIGVCRHALAQSRTEQGTVAEAWQAQALAQAIGSHVALSGPPELRTEARGLGESARRGCAALDPVELPMGAVRAAQLTEVPDVRTALTGLGILLGEVGIALVVVGCATEVDGLYWQCIEAVDAADESGDRVRGMLRRLTLREQDRSSGPVRDAAAGPP